MHEIVGGRNQGGIRLPLGFREPQAGHGHGHQCRWSQVCLWVGPWATSFSEMVTGSG